MRNTILLNIAILLALSALAPAATRLVPSDDYPTIQAAIDACVDGDTVIVAPGTYTGEGNRDIDFLGKAITVRSTDPNNPDIVAATIIDCNGSEAEPHRGFYFHNNEDSNSILDGFAITNGWAINGGGIYCDLASPTITNCVISANTAERCGGGICCGWTHPIIHNCTITNNNAGHDGGGICGTWWRRSCPSISNCTITSNSAERSGGGLSGCGGTISACIISRNHACYGAGLAWSGPISSCIISGNRDHHGSGLEGVLQIINCTIVGNSGSGLCYRCRVVPVNCIIWDNRPLFGYCLPYSCVQGGSGDGEWGIGCISSDPCFVVPGYWDPNGTPNDANDDFWIDGDYHLLPTSPCINAGDPNYVAGPNETDIDGQPRVWDGRVDMGADEFVPSIECAMKFTPQALNPASRGKWVKAHLVLPEGFAVDDVDANTPAVLKLLDVEIESEYMNVFINEDGLVEIEAAFDRAAFCGHGPFDGTIIVQGSLTTGQPFYGTDTIRMVTNNLKYLAALASHWLRTDCGAPDWCTGLDLNEDSAVNFIDFVMFDGCCVEVMKQ